MNKFSIGRIILTTLLTLNLIVLGCISYTCYEQRTFISMLENKIDILAQYQEELIEELEKIVLTTIKLQQLSKIKIDYLESVISDALNLTTTAIKEFNKYFDKLEKKINSKKDIDLKKVAKIKEANVLIKNLAYGFMGSGTHIKINGESYVLTCAHLIEQKIEDNLLVIESDSGTQSKAEIVKYNKKKDLALLKVPQLKNTSYLEIATEAPKEGSEVIIVGNPNGIVDMITDGIITQVDKKGYYIVTNKIWFGNSGGSLLYKGKVVGVLIQFMGLSKVSPFGIIAQNYGRCVSLKEIKIFLKEPNYE